MKTGLEGKTDIELHRLLRMGKEMEAVASARAINADWPSAWVLAGRSLADLAAYEMTARLLEAFREAREARR